MSKFLLVLIAFCAINPQLASAQDAPPAVGVVFQDVNLPVFIAWQDVTNSKIAGELPVSDGGTIPAGKLVIQTLPRFGGAWIAPVQYRIGEKGQFSELTVFRHTFDLKPGQVLYVKCGQPIAPWNGVIVKVDGQPMLVSLARPGASFDLEKWEQGKGGKEEMPNSMLFLAKYGEKVMAQRLAKHHLSTGKERIDHVTVVPSVKLKLTQEVLADAIEAGFKAMQGKHAPGGISIGEDLEQAKKLIKAGRPKAPPKKNDL